jgi:hypothetical protein
MYDNDGKKKNEYFIMMVMMVIMMIVMMVIMMMMTMINVKIISVSYLRITLLQRFPQVRGNTRIYSRGELSYDDDHNKNNNYDERDRDDHDADGEDNIMMRRIIMIMMI